jgi:hypothetical protein
MTAARVFKVPNRLAKAVQLPGGRTVAEALRAADRKIESVRETCVATLQDKVARLTAYAERGRSDPSGALEGLYRTADEIFSVAGAFSLHPLAEAAYGLCDLADRFLTEGPANWQAISVHVNGIRLLSTGAVGDAEAVLSGLREVRARFIDADVTAGSEPGR